MSNNEDKNIIEKIKRIMLSNPILYVFTKEYKTETEYVEFMKQHIDSFKLLPGSETEDEIMERLINMSKIESSINYNLLLSQRKNMLKKEIDRIDSELKLQQDVCDHIKVCIGWNGPFLYRDTSICKCLICGENEPDSRYPLIEAYDYKKEIYSHGELSSYRENRFIELQNLAINILNRKPDLSMAQLVEIISDIIQNSVMSKYQDLAIVCHTNPEIQLRTKEKAIRVSKPKFSGNDFITLLLSKLLDNGISKIDTMKLRYILADYYSEEEYAFLFEDLALKEQIEGNYVELDDALLFAHFAGLLSNPIQGTNIRKIWSALEDVSSDYSKEHNLKMSKLAHNLSNILNKKDNLMKQNQDIIQKTQEQGPILKKTRK